MKENEQNSLSRLTITLFITILSFFIVIISAFKKGTFDFGDDEIWVLIITTSIAIFLTLIVFRKAINDKIRRRVEKYRLKNSVIFTYRRGHLEFLDKYGKKAMYHEECLLRKIKKGAIYEGLLFFDGKIRDEIHTYNCMNSLDHSKKRLTINYGIKRRNKKSIINEHQLQFGYALTIDNSFSNKTESWDSGASKYCETYDMKLSFSKKNKPRNVQILRVFVEDGKEKTKLMPIDPLIVEKYKRIIIKVKILHLQKDDRFRIQWQWDTNKIKTNET